MKKFLMTAAAALALSGCATTGTLDPNAATGAVTNAGMSVFQTAVKQKCQSELSANQYWKMATLVMMPETQTKVSESICGCVTEKAPQTVTLTEVATAVIDPTSRPQVVGKAVVGSLQACMTDFLQAS